MPSYPPLPVDTETHVATTAALWNIGSRYSKYDATYGYQEWAYVKLNGAVSAVAGSVARKSDQGFGHVTVDITDDQLGVATPGGVFRVACTYDSYQFVCIGGRFPDAKGDADIAAGEGLVSNADSVLDTVPTNDEEEMVWAEALEAFATDTLGDVFIRFGYCG